MKALLNVVARDHELCWPLALVLLHCDHKFQVRGFLKPGWVIMSDMMWVGGSP